MAYAETVVMKANEATGLVASNPHETLYQECFHMDMGFTHHTTMFAPALKLAKCASLSSDLAISTRTSPRRNSIPRASARLPDEIISQIAQYILGNAFHGLDVAQPAPRLRKPSFSDIDGMTRASRRLRAISLPEWFRLFIVGHVKDWLWASRLSGMHSWVRHIVCPAKALDLHAPMDTLSRFPYLRSASLSLSCDYQYVPIIPFNSSKNIYPSAPTQLEADLGFNYRQPITSFPPTMTSLSVRATHGSETPLLRNLGLQCPDLRTLRLGKCTMFDSCTKAKSDGSGAVPCGEDQYGQIADGGQCPFWGAFPFDHDIYFGSEGVEAYADELAAELAPLQSLEAVSLGVYLTPHAALAEHRLAHYPLRDHQDVQALAMGNNALLLDPITTAPPNLAAVPPQPPMLPSQANSTQPPAYPSTAAPVVPIPVLPPPTTAFAPWSTSQVAPPPYVNSSLWSYDCIPCRKAYSAPTAAAERTASLILADALPKLTKIEWASFFETRNEVDDLGHVECNSRHANDKPATVRRGTGSHEWRVLRDVCGAVLDVERVF